MARDPSAGNSALIQVAARLRRIAGTKWGTRGSGNGAACVKRQTEGRTPDASRRGERAMLLAMSMPDGMRRWPQRCGLLPAARYRGCTARAEIGPQSDGLGIGGDRLWAPASRLQDVAKVVVSFRKDGGRVLSLGGSRLRRPSRSRLAAAPRRGRRENRGAAGRALPRGPKAATPHGAVPLGRPQGQVSAGRRHGLAAGAAHPGSRTRPRRCGRPGGGR